MATASERLKGRSRERKRNKGLTQRKAREILRHGEIGGESITEKQRRYFGFIAGGGTPRK